MRRRARRRRTAEEERTDRLGLDTSGPTDRVHGNRALRDVLTDTSGDRLSASARHRYEQSFSEPLESVRLHRGGVADAVTARLGAKAVTSGEHVWLGAAAPATSTPVGRQLLGHEIAHVIQSRRGTGSAMASSPGDRSEREADRAGEQAARGAPASITRGTTASVLGLWDQEGSLEDEAQLIEDVKEGVDTVKDGMEKSMTVLERVELQDSEVYQAIAKNLGWVEKFSDLLGSVEQIVDVTDKLSRLHTELGKIDPEAMAQPGEEGQGAREQAAHAYGEVFLLLAQLAAMLPFPYNIPGKAFEVFFADASEAFVNVATELGEGYLRNRIDRRINRDLQKDTSSGTNQ